MRKKNHITFSLSKARKKLPRLIQRMVSGWKTKKSHSRSLDYYLLDCERGKNKPVERK